MDEQRPDPIQILLVEDNTGDARLIYEILRDGRVPNKVHFAKDGLEALATLRGGTLLPDLILLDLNLPKMDGWELLGVIKQDPALKHIPVIVLTSSDASPDIRRCYELQANCYLVKPVDLQAFMKVVLSVEAFWCSIVKLPTR